MVPHKNLAGNKLMESRFEKNYKHINAWREGNGPEIVYDANPELEEQFFLSNPKNSETSVRIVGKESDN